ncbi:hypothetical protein HDV00_009803 [Rhizophlyctis rosea]|nr:hypothetical protein HDV00_009803 [Rhizophlyctis rosea]
MNDSPNDIPQLTALALYGEAGRENTPGATTSLHSRPLTLSPCWPLPNELTAIILCQAILRTPVATKHVTLRTISLICKHFYALSNALPIRVRLFSSFYGGDERYALLVLRNMPRQLRELGLLTRLAQNASRWVHNLVVSHLAEKARCKPSYLVPYLTLVNLGPKIYGNYTLPTMVRFPPTDVLISERVPYQVAWYKHIMEFWAIWGHQVEWWDVEAEVLTILGKDNQNQVRGEDDLKHIWSALRQWRETRVKLRVWLRELYQKSLEGDGKQMVAMRIRKHVGEVVSEGLRPPNAVVKMTLSGSYIGVEKDVERLVRKGWIDIQSFALKDLGSYVSSFAGKLSHILKRYPDRQLSFNDFMRITDRYGTQALSDFIKNLSERTRGKIVFATATVIAEVLEEFRYVSDDERLGKLAMGRLLRAWAYQHPSEGTFPEEIRAAIWQEDLLKIDFWDKRAAAHYLTELGVAKTEDPSESEIDDDELRVDDDEDGSRNGNDGSGDDGEGGSGEDGGGGSGEDGGGESGDASEAGSGEDGEDGNGSDGDDGGTEDAQNDHAGGGDVSSDEEEEGMGVGSSSTASGAGCNIAVVSDREAGAHSTDDVEMFTVA